MHVLALRADRLFDGHSFRRGGATVVLDGGAIVDVLPGRPDLSLDCEVLDEGDATIVPGLVDTHVHLVGDSGVRALDRVAGYTPEQLEDVVKDALSRQLAAGVTTVRDLGDRDWVAVAARDRQRVAAAAGQPLSEPTIVASGPPLTSMGGHCHFLGGEVSGVRDIDRSLEERVARGVDIVKVMASGGMNTQGTDVTRPQFSEEELGHIVRRAHELGLPVTAHAHALAAIEQALAAGVDQVEHCTFLTATGARPDDALVAELGSRRMFVGAGLGTVSRQALAQAPPALREMVQRSGMTPEALREQRLEIVGRLHRAGVRFVAGRDTGISPWLAHGSMWESISFLGDAGATPAEALAAGTSVAAEACGVAERKGRIQRGLDADLVVVNGDPEVDLAALAAVRAVFLGGRRLQYGPEVGPT